MIHFLRSRSDSLKHALSGLWYVIRTQKNAWLHSVATICILLIAYWIELSPIKWAVMILTIGTVWTAEFINSALESIVDLASPDSHPLAKVGKDVGAAAVLIAAISSIIIGLLIIGPQLWIRLRNITLFY